MALRLLPPTCLSLFLLLAMVGCSNETGSDATDGRPADLAKCVACHGTNGRPRLAGVPLIAGRETEELIRALKAYRSGERENALMQAAVRGLSDQSFEDLADWYSSQLPPEPRG